MNVAIAYSKFSTSKSGGARESLLSLLNGLSEKIEISADVYQTPPVDDKPKTNFRYNSYIRNIYSIPKFTWMNQVFIRRQWGRYLRRELTSNYDFLITQDALSPISVQVASKKNIRSVFFIHSMPLTGCEKYDPANGHFTNFINTDLGGRIQYPFLWKNFQDYKQAAQTATYTIANSEFTQKKIKRLFDVEATIIYPSIEPKNYRVKYNPEGHITMINPRTTYKGPDIFLDIAGKMTNETFLLVGPSPSAEIEKRAEKMPNVIRKEWCEDIREAYSSSKLVVVPSRWEEPFGRVPAEAMVSGIPCVVSNRGGLPEVVGNTGKIVQEINNVNEWVDKIKKSLSNHNPQAQIERVEMFSNKKQVEKMVEILN